MFFLPPDKKNYIILPQVIEGSLGTVPAKHGATNFCLYGPDNQTSL